MVLEIIFDFFANLWYYNTMSVHPIQPDITAVILTTNSERLLRECLHSVSFCKHILVVDGGSTDTTIAIAEECGATILHREWDTYPNQYAFALSSVSTEWTFILDSDEICTPELAQALHQKLSGTPEDTSAFLIRRCTWYLNRFLLHGKWYPEWLPRCFRTQKACVRQNEGGHIFFLPEGNTEKIQADILHYTYTSYKNEVNKLNDYAEIGAEALRKNGVTGGIFKAIRHSIGRFIVQYIIRAGFLDGKAGFVLAVHESFYVFSKYIRVEQDSWGAPYNHQKGDISKPVSSVEH